MFTLFNFIRGVVGADVRTNFGEEERRRWSQMPSDILECISDRLSIQDYMVFCCVCRNWRFAPSYRPHIIYFCKYKPWFMFYGLDHNGIDKCYLFSHSYPECCEVRVPHLRGATCVYSKSGWLLAKRDRLFFFCNPITRTSIELPQYPELNDSEQICTFSFIPTSPDCTAFIVSRMDDSMIYIGSYRLGDANWSIVGTTVRKVELGIMKLATYCCDSGLCGKKHENCIIIHGDVGTAVYYHETNREPSPSGTDTCTVWVSSLVDELSFYKKVKALHYKDLLDLTRKGISISTCAVQLARGNCASLSLCDLGVSFDAELSSMKVVWIEPQFTR